ncbi:translational activator of cytochrome c oxidase 1 [Catharus ustulatus]|uniref:translational activator of cytochrome c oxidase 1 n=1 Tax=Catharus ustulatus TaxID=91951 RepID=UPI00140B1D11|nr:translational activator of cytochrome c oxidase 1 [Catharus ustulatus]
MAALGLRLPGLGRAPVLGCRGIPGLGPAPVLGCRGLPPGLGAVPVPPGRSMAGHNRWSKVRNVKGPRDAERSRLFQRMSQLLRAAAREGGPEPSLNPALAAVIQQCRSHNMPKATIEGALRSVRERPAAVSRLLLEARGPGGSVLLLDVLTDNVRRCQAELKELLGHHGASLTTGVRHGFEPVGVVRVSGRTLAMEAALEAAAVAGAQDVVAEDEDAAELKFLCDPSALRSVRQGLVDAGLRPLSAAVEFVPRSPLALAEGPRAAAERLLRALAEWPDIVRLYHNVQDGPDVTGGHSAPAAPTEGQ